MKGRILSILVALLACMLVLACAKQVALTGGAKDVTPPETKASSPANGSTNFSSKRIIVKFNEYIKLNDVSSKLIVSPPMEERPTALRSRDSSLNGESALLKGGESRNAFKER